MTSVMLDHENQAASVAVVTDTRIERADPSLIRVLIVGAGDVGRQLADNLQAGGRHHVVGFVDDDIDTLEESAWEVLGRRSATTSIVRRQEVDEVFVAYAPTWQQQLAEEMTAECPHVGIRLVPTSFEALLRVGRVENHGDVALVRLTTHAACSTEWCKRAFDLALSVGLLVVLAPLLLLIALLIRATSRGPIIFAQERIGRFGKVFTIYKFRTMKQDAEDSTGPVLSSGTLDARLTALGRWLRLFRIDEIPQFWNVLRGEMSLVGPRPERPMFVQKFERMLPSYAKRHQVRPGITGLAQVCGGYHTDARDKLRFDLVYVSHQSLWFDLSILLRTVLVVVFPSNK